MKTVDFQYFKGIFSLEEKNEKALEDEKIQKALVIGLVCGFIFMISVIGLVWYCHSRRVITLYL